MSDIIADLELKVTSSAKGSTEAIDRLSRSLDGLKSSLSGFSDGYEATFTGLANGLSQLKTATTGWDTRGVKSMSSSLTKLSSSAEAVNRAFSVMKSGMIVGDTTGLTALSDALKGFNGFTLDANLPALISSLKALSKLIIPDDLAARLTDVGTALRGFSGFTVDPNLPMLISLLQRVSTVNIPPDLGAQLVRLGMGLAAFGAIVSGLGAIDRSIINLVNALSRLGGVDFASASIGLPIFTRAISDLITTVNAGGGVDRSLTNLINALTRLARATTTANGAISNLNLTVGQVPRHTERAHRSYNNLYMMLIKFRTLLWGIRTAWRALSSSISDASALTEVANVVGTVYSDTARETLEGLSKQAIKDYGMSELAFKQISSRFQAMGTAMGISNEAVAEAEKNFEKWHLINKATENELYGVRTNSMSDMSMTLTELAADIGSFYDTSVEDVQTALASIYTGTTRPLRQFGIDISQTNLQVWAMAQGLNADVQSMTQAEKAMLRYQYVLYSARNALGDFQKTSDTWANQVKILKNQLQQLGIIFGQTFINAFRPALKAMNRFLSAVISFAQQVFNALGAIFGWKIEITSSGIKDELGDVADTVGDISDGAGGAGDNLGKAAKNAGKLKQQLQGFDKLNLLTSDSGSGSGGSGGKGGSGGSGGGSGGGGGTSGDDLSVNITKQENPMFSHIKSLFDLGKFVGDTIADSLNNIDWNHIRLRARAFGTGLASFLNGFFSTDAMAAMGRTLAQGLNTALEELYGFADVFSWEQFGRSCRKFVDNIFLTFDWKLAADTVDAWVQGIADAIIGFFSEDSNKTAILDGLKEFVLNLDPETIALVVGAIGLSMSGALSFITPFGAFTAISEALKMLMTGGTGVVNIPLLLISLAAFDFSQSDKGGIAKFVDDTMSEIERRLEEALPSTLMDVLGGAFAGVGIGSTLGMTIGHPIAGAIIGGIIGGLANAVNWGDVWEEIKKGIAYMFPNLSALGEDVIGWIKKPFEDAENNESILKIGADILGGIVAGIGGAILAPIALGADIITWFVNGFKSLFDIRSPSHNSEIRDIGGNIIAGVVEGIKDFIKTPFKLGKSVFDWIRDGLGGGNGEGGNLGDFSVKVKAKYETTKAKVQEWWGNTKKWFGDGVTSVKSKYETTKGKVKDWWEDTKKWWKGLGKGKDGNTVDIQAKYQTTREKVSTWWNNTKSWWGTRFADVTANLTKTKDSLPESAKTINTTSKFTTAKDALTAAMKNIDAVAKISTLKDALSAAAKTFSSTAKFSSAKDALAAAAKTFTSTANFSKWSKASTFTSTITGMVATIASWSKAHKFSNYVGNMVSQFSSWSKAKSFKNTVTGLVASFSSWISGRRATGGLYKNGKWSPIQQYAAGGSPNAGQVFVAREAGPELVGRLGGHTAVMNNDQIVASVASGVARANQAEIEVLRQQNQILMAILNKRSGIDADSIFNAVRAKDTAYKQRTGRSAFSY